MGVEVLSQERGVEKAWKARVEPAKLGGERVILQKGKEEIDFTLVVGEQPGVGRIWGRVYINVNYVLVDDHGGWLANEKVSLKEEVRDYLASRHLTVETDFHTNGDPKGSKGQVIITIEGGLPEVEEVWTGVPFGSDFDVDWAVERRREWWG